MENDGRKLEADLASFREEWHEEIKGVKEVRVGDKKQSDGDKIIASVEERAAQLFLEGARYEKEGQLNVAVYYYRQAVHLVPDIEFKIADLQRNSGAFDSSEDESDGEVEEYENRLQLDSLTKSLGLINVAGLCSPNTPHNMLHISALPTELLVVLFKWVVSKDLDVKSLARLSLVCKWFYVCARDEEIWKKICLSVWGVNCSAKVETYSNCWRRMFVERPHVKFDGIYISANSYIHIGEPTVGSYYKPCHVVEYYKYLRFFSDGTALIYTSAEDPQCVVQLLQQPPYRDPTVYKGHFRLVGENTVNVYYTRITKPQKDSRRRINREKPEIREHHFLMTLTLKSTAKRRNYQLQWDAYTYQIKNRKTGETSDSQIDADSFKPFFFSGVRNYVSKSVCSL